jgi:hypothetical protein
VAEAAEDRHLDPGALGSGAGSSLNPAPGP